MKHKKAFELSIRSFIERRTTTLMVVITCVLTSSSPQEAILVELVSATTAPMPVVGITWTIVATPEGRRIPTFELECHC
jgi:hypothetical protein